MYLSKLSARRPAFPPSLELLPRFAFRDSRQRTFSRMTNNDDKYTDPELRTQIKEDVQAGDKGGKPGQWSARKAQMMASEYKKQMEERGEEPYTTDKSEQSESQKHLSNWTKEEWQTSDGKADAKQEDGSMERYLPKKAWESMTEEEKEATNRQKLDGGANGAQFVSNTDAAKKARKEASESGSVDITEQAAANKDAQKAATGDDEKPTNASPSRGAKHKREDKGDGVATTSGKAEDNKPEEDGMAKSQPPAKQAKGDGGEKRTTQSQPNGDSANTDEKDAEGAENEKIGDEEHGQPGSAARLPKEGQKVFWRSLPGRIEGTVVEVAYEEKDVDGKHVKASKDDPRIVLKGTKSGKTAVHKPEAVYF